jgi:hypothetical protein
VAVPAVPRPPLSYAQEVLWLAERMRPGTVLDPTCAVQRAFRFPERPDLDLLGRVLTSVVERHDALRSVPSTDGDAVRAEVLAPMPVDVSSHRLPADAGDAELRQAVRAVGTAPYDLEQGPLLRCAWIEHPPGGVLVLGLHHWAGDEGALDALQQDVTALHRAARIGAPPPEAPLAYAEVARRQRCEPLDRDVVDWWEHHLSGARRAALPVAGGRKASGATALASRRLDASAHEAVLRLAGAHRASPFMVLLAVIGALLQPGDVGGHRDLTVFAVDGSRSRRTRAVVGFLAEPLPLRFRFDGAAPLGAAIEEARAVVLASLAHRGVPFLRLLEEAPRLATRLLRPGAPTTVVQYFSLRSLELDGTCGHPLPTFEAAADGEAFSGVVPLDLAFNVERRGDGHTIGAVYDEGLWSAEHLAATLESVETILRRADREPGRAIDELGRRR